MTQMDPAAATRFGIALSEFAPGMCPLRVSYLLLFRGVVRFDDPVLPGDPWSQDPQSTGDEFARWDPESGEVLLYEGSRIYLVPN